LRVALLAPTGQRETPTEVGPPSLTTKLSRFLPPL
jgi:hypothetical protein